MNHIWQIRRIIILVILNIIFTFTKFVFYIRRSSFTFFFKFDPAHLHPGLTTEAIPAASPIRRMLGTFLAFFLPCFVLVKMDIAKLAFLSSLLGLEFPRWAFLAGRSASLHLSFTRGAFLALSRTGFRILTLFAFVTFVLSRRRLRFTGFAKRASSAFGFARE